MRFDKVTESLKVGTFSETQCSYIEVSYYNQNRIGPYAVVKIDVSADHQCASLYSILAASVLIAKCRSISAADVISRSKT